MIVQFDTGRFDRLLDDWAEGMVDGMDSGDDAAFIDANSSTIAALLNRLADARAAARMETGR